MAAMLAACTEKTYEINDNNSENEKQDEIIKYDMPIISCTPERLEFSRVGETKQALIEIQGYNGGEIKLESCWIEPIDGFIISPTTWNSKHQSITIQYVGLSESFSYRSTSICCWCSYYRSLVNGEVTSGGTNVGYLHIIVRK